MAISQELKDLQQRRAEQKALLDEMLKGKSEEERLIIKANDEYKKTLNILREVNEQVKDIQSENKVVVDSLIQQESRLKGLTGLQASLVNLDRQRITAQETLGAETQESINSIASLNQELLAMSAEDVIGRQLKLESINAEIEALRKSETVGEDILKNLEDQRNIATSISNLTEKQQGFLGKQITAYNTIKDSVAGVFETLSLLTSGPAGFFGTALVGAGMFAGKLGEVTKQLGGMRDIGTTALSFIDANAVENAKALSKEFGGMNNITVGLQASTSLIASNMGISGTEAASLLGTFSRLNGNSTDVAKDLMVSTQEFAKQNGIIPSELMSDLAANTEAFAKFGKDGGKNIIQAAAFAKKLGVEFSNITGLADTLLDFESSITKELELGAMLGKNINLDKARQLAFEGDLEGMTKETLKALGGVEEFNKMDVFAKKASADLLGVSVDELQKMVNNQKEADTLSGKLNQKFSFISESASFLANEFGGGFLSMLGGGVMAAAQMGVSFAQMGVDVKGLASKLPVIGKFIGGSTPATPPTQAITPPQTQTGPADQANKMSKIKSGDLIKGAVALVILAGALFIAAKAFQEFGEVTWESVAMGLVSLAGLAGIAFLLSKIKGEMIEGAVAIAILGAALIPFAFALNMMGNVNSDGLIASGIALVAFTAAVFGLGALLSGPGAIIFGAGILGFLALGAALAVLGIGLTLVGNGFSAISSGLPMMVEQLSALSTINFLPILGLAASLGVLAVALLAVSNAGLLALPILAGLGLIAGGFGLFGGDSEAGGDDTMKILVDEIRGLREDLRTGKIGVFMDGTSVASKVSRVVDRIGINSYS